MGDGHVLHLHLSDTLCITAAHVHPVYGNFLIVHPTSRVGPLRVKERGSVLQVHETKLTTTPSNRSTSSHSTTSTLQPNGACSGTVAE